ncbi:MAG: single-stranded-DNA-specific exonuclease RecJ [Planctomycetota bacterium]|nr:MAG: single-stranded-DNA-specific exonuclease RecJ [Planctomycetota bacterium]
MIRTGPAPRCRWRLLPEDPGRRDALRRALDLHPLVAQVLVNRGCADPAAARSMLSPSLGELPDPELLPDFERAVAACAAALDGNRPILIHGDYDVDGIAGSALLARLCRLLGRPAEVFLPDRVEDGYSFSERSLDRIRRLGAGLVVAVDNGTGAVDFIGRIRALGAEVVVLDHHPPGPAVPDAAVVNPWRAPAEAGLFPHFCGTAVAYLFVWGLLRRRAAGALPESWRRFLIDALGLAALATVADVMPLRGPNRALVAEGLRTLGNSGFPGLAALARVAGVRAEPSAADAAFRLAPRLNAAGRLGRPDLAFELLACGEARRAELLAVELDELNCRRREIEQEEMRRLEPQVEEQLQRGDPVLFCGRPEGRFGVLGIVAARLVEATGRPALVWAGCGDGLARGSGRAPEGFDLAELLAAADPWLDGHGGHARAAGFHFQPDRAGQVGAALRRAAAELPPPAPPELLVDAEVGVAELSPGLVERLGSLAPFGEGNPEPLFLASGLELAALRPIGDGSHLELRLQRNGHAVRALGWRRAEDWSGLEPGDRLDVLFHPTLNRFRGRASVEWTLRDLRPVQG